MLLGQDKIELEIQEFISRCRPGILDDEKEALIKALEVYASDSKQAKTLCQCLLAHFPAEKVALFHSQGEALSYGLDDDDEAKSTVGALESALKALIRQYVNFFCSGAAMEDNKREPSAVFVDPDNEALGLNRLLGSAIGSLTDVLRGGVATDSEMRCDHYHSVVTPAADTMEGMAYLINELGDRPELGKR